MIMPADPAALRTVAAILRTVLQLPEGAPIERLRQPDTPTWDSLAHVSIVAALEGELGIEIDPADSLDLTSYTAIVEYLNDRLA